MRFFYGRETCENPAVTDPVTIGNATLYLGDCLEILQGLHRVGAVVTDPPYGQDAGGDGYGRAKRTIRNDTDCSAMAAVAQLAARRWYGSWLAVFYAPRKTLDFFAAMAPLVFHHQIVWDKKVPGLTGRGAFRYMHENIGLFTVGREPREKLKHGFSIQRAHRLGGVHPHQKPVGLMREILRIVPGDLIVDPFMGSGSTGVACVKSGRTFIGIEIESEYFDIACQRIEAAHDQGEFFTDPGKASDHPGPDLLGATT